jgi:hypothetical protein
LYEVAKAEIEALAALAGVECDPHLLVDTLGRRIVNEVREGGESTGGDVEPFILNLHRVDGARKVVRERKSERWLRAGEGARAVERGRSKKRDSLVSARPPQSRRHPHAARR